MKNKIICMMIALCMILAMLPSFGMASGISVMRSRTDEAAGEAILYSLSDGVLTVSGSVSESAPAYAAVYDKNGKMISINVLSSPGAIDVSLGDSVKLIWLNAGTFTAKTECTQMPSDGGKIVPDEGFFVLTKLSSSASGVGDQSESFTAYGYNENGKLTEFSIKADDSGGLDEYLTGNGQSKTRADAPLTYQELRSAFDEAQAASGMPYALCEYITDDLGRIASLSIYGNTLDIVDTSGSYSAYYNSTTKMLKNKYRFTDKTLVFATDATGDTVSVLTGVYPHFTGKSAAIVGYKMNANNTVAAMITIRDWKEAQNSDTRDIIGYLKSIERYADHYEYTIAFGDNASTILSSRTGDVDAIIADDDLFTTDDWITQMGRNAGMIMFNISSRGNIEKMRALTTAAMTTTPSGQGSEYLAAFMVVDIDSAKNTLVLRPLSNAYVNSSGKPISGAYSWSDEEVAGIFAEYNAGANKAFYLAKNANVFIIDPHTTNQAGTKLGTLSDLIPASVNGSGSITEGMVVTLAYNGTSKRVVSIFVNKELVK